MSKVLVDRELLGRVLDPETGEEWSKACRELRNVLAQPAEAKGVVDTGSDAWMALRLLDRLSVDSSDELRVMQIEGIVKSMGAALSAVTAERDGLAAARMAYANEFAPDENGDPDVGNVHANIRALKAERDRLRGAVEDLELALQDAEERAESAGRNASSFEDRMGDLQVENGRLQDRIRPLMAFTQQMARQEGEPYFQRLARAALAAQEGE